MIAQSFRVFERYIVTETMTVEAALKELNSTHIGYRTEGIVKDSKQYEIYYSYIENFSWDDSEETEELEETDDTYESLYNIYESGIEKNYTE